MAIAADFFDTAPNGTPLVGRTATPLGLPSFTWSSIQGGAGFTLQNNRLRSTGSTGLDFVRADLNLGNADQQAEFIVKDWNEGSNRLNIGLILRKDSSSTKTFYFCDLRIDNGSHTLHIFKIINGNGQSLATTGVIWQVDDVLKFTVEGSTLTLYQNGIQRLTSQDNQITSGMRAGVLRNANHTSAVVEVDNFRASNLMTGIPASGNVRGRGSLSATAEVFTPGVHDASASVQGTGQIGGTANVFAPATTVDDGPLIHQAVFNYIPATRALQKLAEYANYSWFIDRFRRLWFQPKDAFKTSIVANSSIMRAGSVFLEETGPRYRNRQYIRGAQDVTDERIEVIFGDNETRSFVLGFPTQIVTKIEVSLLGGAFTDKTIGIKGVDDNVQWSWRVGDEAVSQDTSEEVLTNSDRVRVTYRGILDIVVRTDNPFEIEQRQTLEGVGTGMVEWADDDPTLTDRDAAFEWASSRLRRYGQISRVLKFQTRAKGFQSGQLITVNLPEHGLTFSEMMIESVTVIDAEMVTWYEVQAVEGPLQGSWAMFFANLATINENGIIRENISEEQTLIILKQYAQDWAIDDEPNIFLTRTPRFNLLPSNAIVPSFAFNDRLRFLEVENQAGQVILRKGFEIREGLATNSIRSLAFLNSFDALGLVGDLVWYGGNLATLSPGTGIEIGRRAEDANKTAFEAWQVERQDNKTFADPVPTGASKNSRITITQLAKEIGPDGSQNTPAVGIGGTDLGSMFDDDAGNTWMLFGDTFTSFQLDPPTGHRENALAFTTDVIPSDGITFDGWITDSSGNAKQLFAAEVPAGQSRRSAIPTHGVAIGSALYLFYMQAWFFPTWTVDISSVQKSTDGGNTWTRINGLTWTRPTNFAQVWIRKEGGFVYIFGIPEARQGGVKLMRVLEAQIENKAEYEYLTAVPSTNELINPDFEKGIHGWTRFIDGLGAFNALTGYSTTNTYRNSAGSLELEITSSNNDTTAQRHQDHPIGEGDIRSASVKVKGSHFDGTAKARLLLEWWDAGKANQLGFEIAETADTSGEYVSLNLMDKVAPAGTVIVTMALRVETFGGGSAKAWFDHAELVKGQPVWGKDEEKSAVLIVPDPVGELSVAWNNYLQQYIMLYLNPDRHVIAMRVSDNLYGPWSPETVVLTQTDFPCVYAPYTKDEYVDVDGQIVYFRMSRFCPGFIPYSTYWMRMVFDGAEIPTPNFGNFEGSGTLIANATVI